MMRGLQGLVAAARGEAKRSHLAHVTSAPRSWLRARTPAVQLMHIPVPLLAGGRPPQPRHHGAKGQEEVT